MVELISGVSILLASGCIAVVVKDYYMADKQEVTRVQERDDEGFCDIDMEYIMMQSNKGDAKNINELKKKLQDFKDRNRFYRM
ncbi:hypothetical protein [Maribacter sp. MAR_2009_72]|uniref:hypothetical protein n=1 Tax=Maribacter sp. MAR_2009_72 TaxID=1250050 RepID=UPI00119C29BC|nr:hypothetical protein [Maribacter sp. MAR_2009_72]TVZ16051.1 hypothetical protein JM81_2304 [Maribacter sp. MAR_2009_72]